MELPYYSDNVDLIRRSPILLLNSMKSYWPEMGGWDCAGGAVPSLLGLLLVSVALLRRKTPFMYMRGNVRLSLKYENATKSPWRRLVVAGTFWPLERYTRILSKCGIRTFTMGKELARLQCGSRVYALPGYGRPAIIEPLGYLPLAPDSLHRIVSVGRLSHEKGVDVLIKARAALAADDRDVELVIAGDGAERPALERLACDLGIHDSVRFLGHISDAQDLRSIYLGGGIFVLPSRTEGVPLAMLEAMALGRAVIATAVGGVPTVLEHERNGLLVPPDDDRSLASSIARLMDDIQFAQRLGREAHETGSSYTADAQGAFILQELLPACRNPSAPVAIDKS
jgi:glycosyltransferase involved in cell wall biosynthesis